MCGPFNSNNPPQSIRMDFTPSSLSCYADDSLLFRGDSVCLHFLLVPLTLLLLPLPLVWPSESVEEEEEEEKKRWVNNVGPTRGGPPIHTGIYLFCLTRSFRVMHVSLKQSVNQSHTNSQGSLVAISYGVDAQYPWTERAAIDPSVRACVDCHDGEQYCDSALTIDCLLVALRRSGRSRCACARAHVRVCVCVSISACISERQGVPQ